MPLVPTPAYDGADTRFTHYLNSRIEGHRAMVFWEVQNHRMMPFVMRNSKSYQLQVGQTPGPHYTPLKNLNSLVNLAIN
jgi:hypothetical protein